MMRKRNNIHVTKEPRVPDAIVEIDSDLCLGSGYCERSVPEIFVLSNGTAAVREPAAATSSGPSYVAGDLADRLEAAAMGCPAAAITVRRR